MTDPLQKIAAEFGDEGIIPVPPVKPAQEIDQSDAFKKEMEKKASTVHEKEQEDSRSSTQEEHELAELKPLIKQAIDEEQAKVKAASDPQPTKVSKEPAAPQPVNTPPPPKTVVSSSSEASTDLSQGRDQFSKGLPTPPPASKEKKAVEYTPKQMPAPPLTTPTEGTKAPPAEKPKISSVQAGSSSGQGDTSSRHRPLPQAPLETKAPAPAALPPPVSKQRIETHKETPKIMAPEPKPAIPQSQPLDKPKTAPVEAPLESSNKASPLEEKLGVVSGELLGSHPQENQEVSPLDLEQKATAATSSPFETPFAAPRKDEVTRTSKQELEQGEGLSPVQAPPKSDSSGDGKDQGGSEKQEQAAASQNLLNTLFPSGTQETSFREAIGFDRLPPHVLDLFDRIVGVVTVLQMQGKTETTLHLSDQQSPLFKGAEVTITEVNTAPGSYNIELKGPPEAVAAFQQNVEQLKKAFQRREEESKAGKKEFNFKVNDIRISLKEDTNK